MCTLFNLGDIRKGLLNEKKIVKLDLNRKLWKTIARDAENYALLCV